MELMDATSSINNCIPKIIEFPKHFVLNTQLYDKQTLKPIPMKFFTDNIGNPFMVLQTSIDRTNRYINDNYQFQFMQFNDEHNYQNIIQDKTDSSIFYVKIRRRYNNGSHFDVPYLIKIKYDDMAKKYTWINYVGLREHIPITNNYGYKGDIKILYENDDYFIVGVIAQYPDRGTFYVGYYDNLYTAIGLINKKSFTYTSIAQDTCVFHHLLEGNNDTVYILGVNNRYVSGNTGKRIIYKINTSTKVLSKIWTESISTDKICYCNPVKIGDFYYTLVTHLENGAFSYKMMKISLNTTNDTVNTELLNIDLNNFVLDNSSINSNLAFSDYVVYTLRVIQTDSNIYLSLLMHTVPNMRDVNHNYQHKHVLLKFNGTSFTVVDVVPLLDGCFGSLENGDSKHQVWYMSNCALFYAFDETKEKMICTYRKLGVFMQIGFDSLNRFITQTSERTVEILTDTNACTLQADFAEELYDKDNTSEIDTTVSFYAKNFLDEYIESSVKLTLIGPVIFKENESKELIISTLKTGMRTVPVTITGYGNIQVIITQNT